MTDIRADMALVFVARWGGPPPRGGSGAAGTPRDLQAVRIELLQLRRARNPARMTWQPVMGAIEPGETAVDAARRELREETGLSPPATLGFWALERVPPFYVHTDDAIILAPRFCALARPGWRPQLNDEHDAFRWVRAADAPGAFIWPSQIDSVREITAELLSGSSSASRILRLQ